MPQLLTSAHTLTGGVATFTGLGETFDVVFTGVWALNEKYTLVMTDSTTAVQNSFGAGTITNTAPTFAFTYQDKVYFLAGATVYFSTVGSATLFNDVLSVSPTDGFVQMSNNFSAPENLQAIAPYQGRLVFFSRQTTQIWSVNSDPAQWVQAQVLSNIGTLAPQSVQAMGTLDVMFLSDTGIRSLRVRDSSLNAFVEDIGSPIDALITSAIQADSAGGVNACGVIEPSANRYWLYLNGLIYVLSYFPSSKVIAWSTYTPTFYLVGVQTTFVPQKFVVLKGRVYCLGTAGGNTYIFLYGDTDNNTYDVTPVTGQIPFLDCGSPGTMKGALRVDMLMTGTWTLKGSMNIYTVNPSANFKTLIPATASSTTELGGEFGYTDRGTHFSLYFSCADASLAKLSSMIFHFKKENNI